MGFQRVFKKKSRPYWKIYGKESPEETSQPQEESYKLGPYEANITQLSEPTPVDKYAYAETIEEEEPLSLQAKELEMIKQALIRSKGKRKLAAKELGISERTLYRKIKQYDLNETEDE